MKKLIATLTVLSLLSCTGGSLPITLNPATNSVIATNATAVQAAQQSIDAVKLIVSTVKSNGGWHLGLWSWLAILLAVFGALNSILIVTVALTKTQTDDLWLNNKYLPFIVRWVRPIINILLKLRG